MSSSSAATIASELRRRVPGLPTKKLHKLLYYCQGHHLAATGRPLFGESIGAWDMGPVVGELWKSEQSGLPPTHQQPELDEQALNTIGYVVSRYGRLSGGDLERLTHAEPPWVEANRGRKPGGAARIDWGALRSFFDSAAHAELEESGVRDSATIHAWLQGAGERRASPAARDELTSLRARARGR